MCSVFLYNFCSKNYSPRYAQKSMYGLHVKRRLLLPHINENCSRSAVLKLLLVDKWTERHDEANRSILGTLRWERANRIKTATTLSTLQNQGAHVSVKSQLSRVKSLHTHTQKCATDNLRNAAGLNATTTDSQYTKQTQPKCIFLWTYQVDIFVLIKRCIVKSKIFGVVTPRTSEIGRAHV
jgi:hypothetical protein